MCGTGVGFSVERENVENYQSSVRVCKSDVVIVVDDSKWGGQKPIVS